MKRLLLMSLAGLIGIGLLAAATVCLTSGCSTLGYYAQSAGGHLGVLRAAKPVGDWLAEPGTPAALKQRLELTQRMRDFAVGELKLPDNASYRRYADLKRNAAVWNVVAAPELSLSLKQWCFPIVGCIGYRGYFEQTEAQAFADGLKRDGLEISVYGVPAYSTLGTLPGRFFADPLLNTFVFYGEGDLARLIFHELAHQVAYAKGDTMFNESYATAVERIGSERWLTEHASAETRAQTVASDRRREDFRALTFKYRDKLAAVYADTARDDASKRSAKAAVMAELRDEYAALKAGPWGGFAGYDGWFARANNASFGVLAAYNELVPQFERLFERQGRDFACFHAEVRRLADLPYAERRAALTAQGV